jgi:hypothetical protein
MLSVATAVTMLKSRFAGEGLAWPVPSDLRLIPRVDLGARDLLGVRDGFGGRDMSIVGFAFVRSACLALPRANTLPFSFNLHSFTRHAQLHCCTPLTSPYHCSTLSSISLFTSLRLGLGRFTRFPTRRLPAYHCQYFHYLFPPASKKHESRSRAPWPYISLTNMSSSEDDRPLVKGLFELPHARVCPIRRRFIWLSRGSPEWGLGRIRRILPSQPHFDHSGASSHATSA